MKPKKRRQQLVERQIAHEAMLKRGFTDSGKNKRLASGGFRRPGSLKTY